MELSFDITVSCNVCAEDIKAEFLGGEIIVDPCETCLEKKYDEGASRSDG